MILLRLPNTPLISSNRAGLASSNGTMEVELHVSPSFFSSRRTASGNTAILRNLWDGPRRDDEILIK